MNATPYAQAFDREGDARLTPVGAWRPGESAEIHGTRYVPAPPEGAPEYWELARAVVRLTTDADDPAEDLEMTGILADLADRLRPLVAQADAQAKRPGRGHPPEGRTVSLDVYLTTRTPVWVEPIERIFVREDGSTREVSREEWERRWPGVEPVTLVGHEQTDRVYSANITHNLGRMAGEAGLYEALWRPEGLGITRARELVGPLRAGLDRLRAEPGRYRALNPENGWGSCEGLVRFVEDYLRACEEHPDAEVSVSR